MSRGIEEHNERQRQRWSKYREQREATLNERLLAGMDNAWSLMTELGWQ